jgi:hypothetical protein
MKANFRFSFGRGLNLCAANRATGTTKYSSKCGFFIIVVLENTKRVLLQSSVMPFSSVLHVFQIQAQYFSFLRHKDTSKVKTQNQTLQ